MLLDRSLARVDCVRCHSPFFHSPKQHRIAGMQEPIPVYQAEGRETWIYGGFTIYLNLTLVLMW